MVANNMGLTFEHRRVACRRVLELLAYSNSVADPTVFEVPWVLVPLGNSSVLDIASYLGKARQVHAVFPCL